MPLSGTRLSNCACPTVASRARSFSGGGDIFWALPSQRWRWRWRRLRARPRRRRRRSQRFSRRPWRKTFHRDCPSGFFILENAAFFVGLVHRSDFLDRSFPQGSLDIRAPEFPTAMPEYHDRQNFSVNHVPERSDGYTKFARQLFIAE
jgi:hypothetical protein